MITKKNIIIKKDFWLQGKWFKQNFTPILPGFFRSLGTSRRGLTRVSLEIEGAGGESVLKIFSKT